MRRVLALAACVLLLLGCPQKDPAPPPLPPGGEPCARACLRLRQLGCEEGGTTPAGKTCESVCENVQSSGYTTLDVDCLQTADSCDAARRCK